MKEYRHGAYGVITDRAERESLASPSVPVYIGTAPVNTVTGGADNVNRPVLVKSYAEAVRKMGYVDDTKWDEFTLCEAIHAHFVTFGASPIVLINVLDPAEHKAASQTTKQVTPTNGRATIAEAQLAILDSVDVTSKTKGADYDVTYNATTGVMTISELTEGALGTEALTITYDTVDPSLVTAGSVIGNTDGEGINTGIYAVRNVYPLLGVVPSILLAPGFTGIKAVRDTMVQESTSINGHWGASVYTDIPLADGSARITLSGAATWKVDNGYSTGNEKVFFPKAVGEDDKIYHLSTLAACVRQMLDAESGGRPYRTPSNQPAYIKRLYFGADANDVVIDDKTINEKLCAHGITSAAYVGGRNVIWGAHASAYDFETNPNASDVADTNRAMLMYLSNDFQIRRANEVDKPMSIGRLKQIVSEEQSRLDALVTNGMIVRGVANVAVDDEAIEDMIVGDFKFTFTITTMPLAKSLTVYLTPSDEGMDTYYKEG